MSELLKILTLLSKQITSLKERRGNANSFAKKNVQTPPLLTDCPGSNLELRIRTQDFTLTQMVSFSNDPTNQPHQSGKVINHFAYIINQTC